MDQTLTMADILAKPKHPNSFGGYDTDMQQPLRSNAGWYIGSLFYDSEMNAYVPYHRDSVEYWATRIEVVEAMQSGEWQPRI